MWYNVITVRNEIKETNPQLKLHNKESNMTKKAAVFYRDNRKSIVHEVSVKETGGTTEVSVEAFMQDRGLLDSLDLRLLQDQLGSLDAGDDEVESDEVNESGMHTLTEEEFLLECQQDRHYAELGEQVYN